ncbi:DnaK family protein [Dictyocaulus viviparus]|uniref:Heat shock 70 kDa protein 13 n=1 Tax=Dictyocaulus viviparus TaxID=29172 RepID=A0A0D8XDM5_DICVI|nr:DnaK family protein [Dictyocaulus viviparus]
MCELKEVGEQIRKKAHDRHNVLSTSRDENAWSNIISGGAILALLIAGYIARQYGLPPPAPKIAGVDLGTTFSSIGIYHAVTGETTVFSDDIGKKSIPSVVAFLCVIFMFIDSVRSSFLPNGTILVGTQAVEQQEKNPQRTIYDAKRFIGRTFEKDNENFLADQKRYPFVLKLDDGGHAYFEVPLNSGIKKLYPQEVGSIIISYLKNFAEKRLGTKLNQVVISVPAEFGENQRNVTGHAAELAGMEVRRVISEPTAASLAYGLHKKKGVETVVVIDLGELLIIVLLKGGGTLDVSVLWLQGGVFVTQAMAGNNRLGGQDFNDRVQKHVLSILHQRFGEMINDREDLQQIRLEIENAKIRLTTYPKAVMKFHLKKIGVFQLELRRDEFEELNYDLFKSIEQPIKAALDDAHLEPSEVDEIVLVGGSTRIPKVRQIIGHYFGKPPNFGIDPELAVVTGAAVQAGVIGGGWPLQVTAMELPTKMRKRHFYTEEQRVNEKEMSV